MIRVVELFTVTLVSLSGPPSAHQQAPAPGWEFYSSLGSVLNISSSDPLFYGKMYYRIPHNIYTVRSQYINWNQFVY